MIKPEPAGLSAHSIIARLERLPITSWHVRARMIVGAATFFDAFDVLAISVVLPVLAGQWHLSPSRVGLLISTGFAGQLAGAFLFGWAAEKFGRLRAMVYSIAVFACMSLACAFAWNYTSLFVCRTIQGIGIGGEVPVAAAYINEISKARGRGRFFLLYEIVFGMGLTSAGLVGYWAVPRIGWQSMFILGALPAFLALALRRILPESPRWLVSKGRLAEADRVVGEMEDYAQQRGIRIEPPAPFTTRPFTTPAAPEPSTHWPELFSPTYLRRTLTVWALWFCCYFVSYGLTTWLPTIYRTVFKLDIATALRFGLATNLAGLLGDLLVAFTIDRIGRRTWFAWAFFLGALPLAALPILALRAAGSLSAIQVMVCASLSYVFVASNSVACYLYTPEIYPTRLRALGSSIATAWLRAGSAVGPVLVGLLLTHFDLGAVFLMFGLVSLAGAVAATLFATETRERVLEEISP
ncbi:MAG TPA: MFS transporter [Bryobacteraceae bacterium]|nr:MFS transporter [Bryobacteraceae bacterium]